jgi:glycosyltransferase involved in cell wall biosynthesis
LGLTVEGAPILHLFGISFMNITLLSILFNYRRPNIIHFHWQHSLFIVKGKYNKYKMILKSVISLLQLIIIKMTGIRIVWTAHNLKDHENTHQSIQFFFTKYFARCSDLIIAHCDTAKSIIVEQFNIKKKDKVIVIPHGNFLGYYRNEISRKRAQQKLNVTSEEITFLFLGEIRYYKGVLELVDAFLSLKHESMQLIIAGRPFDAQIAEKVKQKINSHKQIRLVLEFIPNDELQLYINASDVMVFPYCDIFSSGGVMLALSFGKPIIAPRLGCIPDVLDSSGSFLYDSFQQDGLLQAMEKTIRSKDKFARMGNHNFELAKKGNWNDIGQVTHEGYLRVVQK